MENNFTNLKKTFLIEKKIIGETSAIYKNLKKTENSEERKMMLSQLESLSEMLVKTNNELKGAVSEISLIPPLIPKKISVEKTDKNNSQKKFSGQKIKLSSDFEQKTIERLKKRKDLLSRKKEKKPNAYAKNSNKIFSDFSENLLKKGKFTNLKKDLIKSNLKYLPKSYISMIFFTTIISFVMAFFIFLFFMFFNLSATIPFITLAHENLLSRFVKIFWILIFVPLATFLMIYFYPSMEKKSLENRINQELPFAAINMAAVSGSMVDPTKIFEVMIATREYPHLEKEFTKLLNETSILGYDLVSALRNRAFNSPSKKLSELFNGLATTINSGGDLAEFFQKRSQTLLLDYKLEREKYTRSAETFMDIYISVVIAAPMILMLLLMMMKISGLGVSLSTSMITLIMVLGVSIVNIAFLAFLHLRQPTE